jgi:CRISPR system Cascade subunit CasE
MTYLSRIRINPLRAASQKLLASPRAMHGAVMGGITGPPGSERVLWRLDADNPHRPHLFVLTHTKPDWTHIVEQAGWPGADGEHAAIRDYNPLLDQIATGREFAFRLTASPVQNTKNPVKPSPGQAKTLEAGQGRGRGLRMGHRTAAAQLDWFLKRTESWGFLVPDARIDPPAPGLEPVTQHAPNHDGTPAPSPAREVRTIDRRRHSFTKNGRDPLVVIHTATFEGRLRITDPETLTNRLLNGIGPSKAYGCGLLTLSPLPGQGG